jgi:hypothetical protein
MLFDLQSIKTHESGCREKSTQKKKKKKPGKKKSCISYNQTKRKIKQMHIYAIHEQEACIHSRRTPK